MVMKCHPGVAVVAVYHCHPVRLVPLKTISLVPLTTTLIASRQVTRAKSNYKSGAMVKYQSVFVVLKTTSKAKMAFLEQHCTTPPLFSGRLPWHVLVNC
jgi:hypothetical protein